MKTTSTFSKIAKMRGLLRVVQGGTSGGKTYAIMQLLHHIGENTKKKRLITVATDTTPNLKTGAIRDFKNILQEEGVWDSNSWNATDKIYKYKNAEIEFVAFDKDTKARGGRRDILFVNECNRLAFPIIDQLLVRTREYAILDYNPVVEFWLHDKRLLDEPTTSFTIVNYKDNECLQPNIVARIEQKKPVYDASGKLLKGDPAWWKVYGEGNLGVYEGLIFKEGQHWNKKELPGVAELICYGLDFGYSNDPSTLVAVYYCNGEYYLQEIFYETGLNNLYRDDMTEEEKISTIQYKMEFLGIDKRTPILADAAEPKSIEDIRRLGYKIRAAKKGKDSIKNGIDYIQSLKPNITPDSVNGLKEARTYTWKEDKDGKTINEPVDKYNHFWDAVRYALSEKRKEKEEPEEEEQDYDYGMGGNPFTNF